MTENNYYQEIGTRESDPIINAQIRRQLGLESKVDSGAILQAVRLFKLTETGEHITQKEILKTLVKMKRMGIPIKSGYRSLKYHDLNSFFRNTQAEVYSLARDYGFDPMAISL